MNQNCSVLSVLFSAAETGAAANSKNPASVAANVRRENDERQFWIMFLFIDRAQQRGLARLLLYLIGNVREIFTSQSPAY